MVMKKMRVLFVEVNVNRHMLLFYRYGKFRDMIINETVKKLKTFGFSKLMFVYSI